MVHDFVSEKGEEGILFEYDSGFHSFGLLLDNRAYVVGR